MTIMLFHLASYSFSLLNWTKRPLGKILFFSFIFLGFIQYTVEGIMQNDSFAF